MPEPNHAQCTEQERLFAELTRALKNVVEIQGSQMAALKLRDTRASEFEEEIRVAIWALPFIEQVRVSSRPYGSCWES